MEERNEVVESIRKSIEEERPYTLPDEKFSFWKAVGKLKRPAAYIGIIVLWLLANYVATLVFVIPISERSVFVLSNLIVKGSKELCPGETLDFSFDVDVKSVGTFNLWMSTWKVDPPPSTIVFSEIQPFVIGSPRSFPIQRKWKIPLTYNDPADSVDKPMAPGAYTRDISVTAEGRNTRNDPLLIGFRIRDDCPSQEVEEEP